MPPTHLKPDHQPLALLYRDGQAFTSDNIIVPRYSDISLTKDSQEYCESAIDIAKNFGRPIRSDKECQDYIALHSLVDDLIRELRSLAKVDREAWAKVLSQITTAVEPILTQLLNISNALKERITHWRAVRVEGQRREQERLQAEAQEKHNEAKYTDDPKKRRQATVQAKQLETAAHEAAPKPEKGVDTEEYWEGEVTNRLLAAKLPEELVYMEVDQQKLNQRLKAMQRAGERITPNIFPGLSIERKTRVRFHR